MSGEPMSVDPQTRDQAHATRLASELHATANLTFARGEFMVTALLKSAADAIEHYAARVVALEATDNSEPTDAELLVMYAEGYHPPRLNGERVVMKSRDYHAAGLRAVYRRGRPVVSSTQPEEQK